MTGLLLGAACAIGFACADFFGGLASRHSDTTLVTAISRVLAVPVVGLFVLLVPAESVSTADVLLGMASGVAQLGAFRLLYGVLSRGAMGVSAALTGLLSAVVPLAWALNKGESMGVLGIAGVAIGLVSILVVSWSKPPEDSEQLRSDPFRAAGAGVLFGLAFVTIGSTSSESQAVPLLVGQVTTALLASAGLVFTGALERPSGKVLSLASCCGVAAALASASFVWSVHAGVASVVSVLQATAPVFVALLAWLILKEKLKPRQVAGLVMAIAAAALLSF